MNNAPEIFYRSGFTHRLMKQEGRICLYSLTKRGRMSYEVVRLQSPSKDNPLTGRKHGVLYLPSSSMWGREGWSYNDLKEAERKYSSLILLTSPH